MRARRLRFFLLAITLGVTAGPGSAGAQQARRPMTLADAYRMVSIGGGQISPDGRWVLFSSGTRDFVEDKSETTWWLAPTDGSSEPRRFIGEEGGSGFTWAPDSGSIYFSRAQEKVIQIFQISLQGGEALPITEWKEGAGGSWTLAPDGSFFIIRKDEKDEAREKRIKEGWDQVYVNDATNGQDRDDWSNLWKYDLPRRR